MLSVAEFFAESHRGNAFGIKGPLYGPGGHRGDDTNGWALGTGIPSFVTGSVVASVYYVSLGWTTTVWAPAINAWVSFCHEYSRGPGVGTPISIGSWVGPLGNSGTLSLGKHVHVVVSHTSSDPRSGSVVDPRPYINAAKSGTAGGGGTPLPDDPAHIEALEGDDMITILIELTDNSNRYGSGANAKYFSLYTPASKAVQKINDPALANQLVIEFGRKDGATGAALGSGYNCAYKDWEAFHGGSYDPRKP